MKRIIVLITAVFVVLLNATGQKAQLFVKAGATISKFTSENIYNFYEVNSLVGYQAGILSRLPFSNTIALQPSLQIISKGAKTKTGIPPFQAGYANATTSPVYLELPVLLVFDIPLKSNGILFAGAGLYGAVGIGGKNKIEGFNPAIGAHSDEMKIDFGDEEEGYGSMHNYAGIGYMKKYDYGIATTVGFRIKRLLIAADFEWGLQNIDRGESTTKDENKNRVFCLSLGWQIF